MVIINGVESLSGDPGLLANDLANYLSDGQRVAGSLYLLAMEHLYLVWMVGL